MYKDTIIYKLRCVFYIFLCLPLCFVSAENELDENKIVPVKIETHTPNNQLKIIPQLEKLLKLGIIHFPELQKEIESDEKQLINLFLKQLDNHIQFYEKESEIPDNNIVKSEPKFFPCVTISDNKIIYLRLDVINNDILKQFRENLSTLLLQKSNFLGVVIDLRMSQYGEYKNLKNLSEFFRKKFKKSTIVILTGGKTCGASEVYASLMSEHPNALIIGDKTFGQPFELIKIKLDKIGFITGYKKPEFYNKKLKIIIPDVKINPYPQISPNRHKDKDEKEKLNKKKYDDCIQAAIDIIFAKKVTCSDALKQKKMEKMK